MNTYCIGIYFPTSTREFICKLPGRTGGNCDLFFAYYRSPNASIIVIVS